MDSETKQQIEFAENTIKDLLARMGFLCSLEFQEGGEDNWFIIKTPGTEAPLLIGDGGKHLFSFTYLIKRIYEQKFPGSKFRFLIDVNDYNKKRIE